MFLQGFPISTNFLPLKKIFFYCFTGYSVSVRSFFLYRTSAVVEGWTAGMELPLLPYLFLRLPLSQTLALISKCGFYRRKIRNLIYIKSAKITFGWWMQLWRMFRVERAGAAGISSVGAARDRVRRRRFLILGSPFNQCCQWMIWNINTGILQFNCFCDLHFAC